MIDKLLFNEHNVGLRSINNVTNSLKCGLSHRPKTCQDWFLCRLL